MWQRLFSHLFIIKCLVKALLRRGRKEKNPFCLECSGRTRVRCIISKTKKTKQNQDGIRRVHKVALRNSRAVVVASPVSSAASIHN